MFTLGITGLITAYILVAVLLLSINLYSNWSWRIKAFSVVITSVFYIIVYVSYPPILGWPTKESTPERFRLIGAHVQQPDKITGDEGAVYLWLSTLDDLTSEQPPRSYELPYSDELHEMVIHAKAKLEKGTAQLGETENLDDPNAKPVEGATRTTQISTKVQFYDMPDPLFPDK